MPRIVQHLRLGRTDYREALSLQRALHVKRCAGEIGDLLLSVEHNPVFTIGRTGSRENLLVDEAMRIDAGIDLVDIERGGDITYHGPGQLVLYPILDLRSWGKDIHTYICNLEEVMIRTLAGWGIEAGRKLQAPGAWVGERKIGSIGVHVKRWVSLHGLALNVDIDPAHVAMIRPCGLSEKLVSITDLRNGSACVSDVLDTMLPVVEDVLACTLVESSAEELMERV